MYIPHKHTNQLSQREEEEDSIISSTLTTITNSNTIITTISNTIITADVNAQSSLWYSPNEDLRGEFIEDILLNSNHITLKTNTPTRLPSNQNNSLLHQISLLLQQNFMSPLAGRPSTPSHQTIYLYLPH